MTRIIQKQKITFAVLLVVFVFFPQHFVAQAQECPKDQEGYCLLEPIFADQVNERVDMARYLASIYKVFFITAGILATLMLIVGGFQYMTSEIPGMKGKGKDQMNNAIFGLLLAFGSWLLLNTINPGLTNINFNLRPIPNIQKGTDVKDTLPNPNPDDPNIPKAGAWPSDQAIRNEYKLAGIGVVGTQTNESCAYVGEQGCTSLYGMPSSVLSKLTALNGRCPGGCNVIVTGGTEEWAHATHGPGKAIVDVDDNTKLDTYITRNGFRNDALNCGLKSAPKYNILGSGIYVDEGNHWHICY